MIQQLRTLGAHGNPLALFASAGVCALAGLLVALPALRLSGVYFALSTAAFATAMDAWVFPLPSFDVFGDHFAPFGTGSLTYSPLRVGGLTESKSVQFVIGAAIFLVLTGAVVLVRRANFGSQLFAFKDSPIACATLGMNTRRLTMAVFAFSAAIAGVGGALYGQSLGSASPDVFQFFGGLSVLLTMVILGIGSIGAGAGSGLFLGGPALTKLFPSLLQLQSVLIGGAAVAVGTSPNGAIPAQLRPQWMALVRRPRLLIALVAVVLVAWGLRLGGAIHNWTLFWCVLAVALLGPALPMALDRRSTRAAGILSDGADRARLTSDTVDV